MRFPVCNKFTVAGALAIAMAALAGCGGGGGTASSSGLTLSGTAATGLAIGNAPVDAKCASGTGSATTAADGSFTLTVANGTLPCVLRVVAADKSELHSVTEGTQTTANITPVSEMLLARAAGLAAKTFFDNFDPANDDAKLTTTAVAGAKQTVLNTLKNAGVDMSGHDPLHDTLKAANGTNTGDDLDKKLDDLKTKLTEASVSVDDVAQALADNKDASDDSASAAAEILLQPSSSSCAALHSGDYRVIYPGQTNSQLPKTEVVNVNATTLTLTNPDGSTDMASPVTSASCAFQSSTGRTKYLFTKSGAVALYHTTGGTPDMVGFAFPEQQLKLADLEGTWDSESFTLNSGTSRFEFSHAIRTIAADGSTQIAQCGQTTTSATDCAAAVAAGGFSAASSGGGFVFTPTGQSSTTLRTFVFRAPNGNLAMVVLEPNNGWTVATKQNALKLPAVGTVNNFWDVKVMATGSISAVQDVSTTITAVDTAAATFTRTMAGSGQIDTFTINKPYNGLSYRAGGTVPTSSGSTTVSSLISMKLQGMGLTVYGKPVADSTSFFGVKVDKP